MALNIEISMEEWFLRLSRSVEKLRQYLPTKAAADVFAATIACFSDTRPF